MIIVELIVGVNSYISVDEAKNIANDYIFEENKMSWLDTLSENDISKLINISTKKIEKLYFKGVKVTPEQNMQFPRIISGKNTDIPEDLKIAIVLQAVEDGYSVNDEEIQLRDKGVSKYSVDGASIEFSEKAVKDKLNCGIYVYIFSQYLKQFSTLIV